MTPAFEASELTPTQMGELLDKGEVDLEQVAAKGLWDGRVHVRRNAALAVLLKGEVPQDKVALLPIAAKDSDPVVREHIVGALGKVAAAPETSVPALIRGVLDGETPVSDAALKSLEQVVARQEPGALEQVVEVLGDHRPFVQVTAVDLVVRRGEPAVPVLVGALGHVNTMVRKGARQCLRMLGSIAADQLIDALADDALRDQAKQILDRVPLSDKHEAKLAKLIKDGEPIVQMVAKRLVEGATKARQKELERAPVIEVEGFGDSPLDDKALKAAGKQLDVPTALRALVDANPVVRANACAFVRVQGAKGDVAAAAIEKLTPATKDADEAVRLAAVQAVASLDVPAAAVPLVRAVADGHASVAEAARAGLDALAPGAPIALISALSGSVPVPCHEAVLDALAAAGAKPVKALATALQIDEREVVRAYAAEALGRLKSDGAGGQDALVGALRDKDETVRQAAAWSLGEVAKVGDEAVLEALAAMATDSVPEVRQESAAAHAKVSGKPVTPKVLGETALPLPGFDSELLSVDHCKANAKKLDAGAVAPLLFDGRPVVRANAASALGGLGKAAAPHLLHLCLALKDGDVRVRIATAFALQELSLEPETSVPALTAALRGADGELEEALLAAIESFGKKVVEPVLGLLGGRPEQVASSIGKIARHLPKLFVDPLAAALSGDGSVIARENAADVLADLGDVAAKAEGALLDALSQDAVLFRVKIIRAIGRVAKPSKKVAELLDTLQAEDQRLSIQDAVDEARMWLRSRS